MEKIVLEGTESLLKNKAIIRHSQYGFIKGKSTLSNLISFYNKVIDDRWLKEVNVIFLDVSKGSDTIFDGILLGILSSYEINWFVLFQVKWLNGRARSVAVKGSASRWRIVTTVIRQGSTLRLFSFKIFVSGLDEGLECYFCNFADNTKLGSAINSLEK